MKYLMLFLLPMCLVGQNYISETLFVADSITSTTAQDTVDWVGYIGGTSEPAWIPITNYISAAEKAAGVTLVYDMASESSWTWFESIKIRVRSSADTITSRPFSIGSLDGAVSLFIKPDTSLGYTIYTGSKIGGN